MAILVNELRDIRAIPIILFFILSNLCAYFWFWITLNIFLVSVLVYKTSTLNTRRGVEDLFAKFNSPPPHFAVQLGVWLHEWIVKVIDVLDHLVFCLSSDLNAPRTSFERLHNLVAKLATARNEVAAKNAETKVAIAERDAAIACQCTDAPANEKQALFATIKYLESAYSTLSDKLKMSEMNVACLEEQISLKKQSQNFEILKNIDKLQGELTVTKAKLHASEMNVKWPKAEIAVKATSQDEMMLGDVDKLENELKAANADSLRVAKDRIVGLDTECCDSELNVISLEQQIAAKTESQNEIIDGMDQVENELKAVKIKLQEAVAQKSAMERDLVELRELVAANQVAQTCAHKASDKKAIAQKTTEIAQLREQLTEAIRTEPPLASELTFHPGLPAVSVPRPRTPQLNTPPTSPRNSLLFGSAKVSFAKKANISPSSSKFGLSSRRAGKASANLRRRSSVQRGRTAASPIKTDKV